MYILIAILKVVGFVVAVFGTLALGYLIDRFFERRKKEPSYMKYVTPPKPVIPMTPPSGPFVKVEIIDHRRDRPPETEARSSDWDPSYE